MNRNSAEDFRSQPLLITFEEAGRLLGVSRRTVDRLCQSGRLTVVRVTPDTPRVRMSEVERLAGLGSQ